MLTLEGRETVELAEVSDEGGEVNTPGTARRQCDPQQG